MFDILIKNGQIIDGSGAPTKKMDVAINSGKIVGIGYFKNEKAKKEINGENRLISPGFIDINTSADHDLTLWRNRGDNMLLQGVTTIIGGRSGVSLAPLIKPNLGHLNCWTKVDINIDWTTTKEFFNFLKKQKLFLNYGTFIGWGLLRSSLINNEFRPLTKEELNKLLLMVRQSLKEGAFGVSFGLGYNSEQAVGISEIKAVAEVVNKYHGSLSFYLRDYSNRLLCSLEEALSAIDHCQLPIEIELLKSEGQEKEKLFNQALTLIDEINKKYKAEIVTFDIIPYDFEVIPLYNLLPDWALVGGRKILMQYITNNETKKYLIQELKKKKYLYENLIITNSGNNWWLNNKSLKEIANNFNQTLEDTILRLIEITGEQNYVIVKSQTQDNIEKGILNNHSFITANSGLYDLNNNQYRIWFHPKTFGTFPKFIADFIIAEKQFSWEEGIRKLTGKVADQLKIKDRGYIKKNYYADLVVINPNKIKDRSTLLNPFQYSEGIEFVIINGKIVYQRGIFESKASGNLLLKSAK